MEEAEREGPLRERFGRGVKKNVPARLEIPRGRSIFPPPHPNTGDWPAAPVYTPLEGLSGLSRGSRTNESCPAL